jgi:hypothetical protein
VILDWIWWRLWGIEVENSMKNGENWKITLIQYLVDHRPVRCNSMSSSRPITMKIPAIYTAKSIRDSPMTLSINRNDSGKSVNFSSRIN